MPGRLAPEPAPRRHACNDDDMPDRPHCVVPVRLRLTMRSARHSRMACRGACLRIAVGGGCRMKRLRFVALGVLLAGLVLPASSATAATVTTVYAGHP